MLVALAVALTDLTFAFQALANGGKRNGMPAFPFILFAVVALLASIGDLRMMRSGPLQGASRLARHLWRMCFALFIAALSFFIGQAKVIPAPYRNRGLLALPVLAVLVTMLYWLWRVRRKRALRSTAAVSAPHEEKSRVAA
jgi:ATP adenylyltransferase/5',5'''-P-1,P-4-tetraphosphate phosphorylase II